MKEPSLLATCWKNRVPIFVGAVQDGSIFLNVVKMKRVLGESFKLEIDVNDDVFAMSAVQHWCSKRLNKKLAIWILGGGVPKNFAQDIVVAAEVLGYEAPMHKYALQITVADVRDGALSGSTLKEASSWGKVDTAFEQMVYSEATLALPLIAGYGYHKGAWKDRTARRWNHLLEQALQPA